jgi:shikimate kinase
MKTNIALIGYMATGKSAVGMVLADRLSRELVETDLVIEKKANKTISRIFNEDGELAFREYEIAVTKEIAGKQRLVIACGGGIVLNWINIERLRQNSRLVYLTATPPVILKRVFGEESKRPLIDVENPMKTIRAMMRFRKPFYERAADFTIDTSELEINTIAEEIFNRLKADEGFGF